MIPYETINNIIHYDTNNIIEFIDRYIWCYCKFGYSSIENNIISKDCVWDNKNNIRCFICRHLEVWDGRLIEGLVITKYDKYDVFVQHNFSFIIDAGIII